MLCNLLSRKNLDGSRGLKIPRDVKGKPSVRSPKGRQLVELVGSMLTLNEGSCMFKVGSG